MKQKILIFIMILFTAANISAQDFSRKYGNITTDELQMTVYNQDTNADAVILYEVVDISYDVSSVISIIYDYKIKIKILTKDGTTWGDGQIILYEGDNIKENLSHLEASAYNFVNGNIRKDNLANDYIHREKIDEVHTAVKFSIPEVRAGTVIEYQYRIISNYILHIPEINMQHSIPVKYSKFTITAPEYFSFNYFNAGYSKLNIKRKQGIGYSNLNTGSYNTHTFKTNIVWCEKEYLPALKSEPYNWCLDDSRIRVEFEISAISLPNGVFEKFTNTWKDVNDKLRYMGFNSDLKTSYPFKKEVLTIKKSKLSEVEKIKAILKLVQSKMSWNGKYRLLSNKLSDAIKKGEGSSADINFVLHSALQDAGFDVVPVLLNPRSFGRIPTSFPTINKINTFIVKVNLKNTQVFIDGTNTNSNINILPIDLLSDRARIYKVNDDSGWVDLTNLTKSVYSSVITCNIDESGVLSGTIKKTYTNQAAYVFANSYENYKTKEEYIEYFEKESNIEIEDIDIQGLDSLVITETIKFKASLNSTSEYIYLNSLVFQFISENPFKQQERMLPIEFDYPIIQDITCNIKYPETYKIEEKPENANLSACENGVKYTYMSQASYNNLQIKFSYSIDKLIFSVQEYKDLRTFYGMLTQMSDSQIVIKKNQ
ncbi:MAG: DUF3857 domain-containing protein [Prevotellaceae bacterium]|jgi:hypothetical protein|nr:DUF3857 domain-containing protein [Prevotellaceae bacterium]